MPHSYIIHVQTSLLLFMLNQWYSTSEPDKPNNTDAQAWRKQFDKHIFFISSFRYSLLAQKSTRVIQLSHVRERRLRAFIYRWWWCTRNGLVPPAAASCRPSFSSGTQNNFHSNATNASRLALTEMYCWRHSVENACAQCTIVLAAVLTWDVRQDWRAKMVRHEEFRKLGISVCSSSQAERRVIAYDVTRRRLLNHVFFYYLSKTKEQI